MPSPACQPLLGKFFQKTFAALRPLLLLSAASPFSPLRRSSPRPAQDFSHCILCGKGKGVYNRETIKKTGRLLLWNIFAVMIPTAAS